VKRPHFEIDAVGSHFSPKTKTVEEGSDCTDNDESSPRNGSEHDHENGEASEKSPNPRLAKSLYFTKSGLYFHEWVVRNWRYSAIDSPDIGIYRATFVL